MPNHAISINGIADELHDEVFSLICNVFAKNSVLHSALEISTKEYRCYAAPWFEAMVQQKFSLVALDENTQKVVGCLLACDYANQVSNPSAVPEKFRPLSALLSQLDHLYSTGGAPLPGERLLVDIAVVHPDAGGKGVYRQLRESVHHIARAAGFQLVIGELSSAATQYVCVNKMGQRICAEISYASFEYEGRRPFASISDPHGIQLVEAEL